jgi:hypothetical protein
MQRKEAIKLKEEYHAFRDRAGVVLFLFAAVLLVGLLRADAKREAGEPFSLTPPFMVGVQGFLAWLLYFYTALALRENVLKVRTGPHLPGIIGTMLIAAMVFYFNFVVQHLISMTFLLSLDLRQGTNTENFVFFEFWEDILQEEASKCRVY